MTRNLHKQVRKLTFSLVLGQFAILRPAQRRDLRRYRIPYLEQALSCGTQAILPSESPVE